ncbi:hypothetical protein MASR2M18_03780 [Ignavibacteria bacterium]|nr:S1 RNA-binding domain-containing protein [Bacteroidota bacterium]MCZ2133406.1 S1 RNA-binding domain-containing protein [Bacteroidota bacterium]
MTEQESIQNPDEGSVVSTDISAEIIITTESPEATSSGEIVATVTAEATAEPAAEAAAEPAAEATAEPAAEATAEPAAEATAEPAAEATAEPAAEATAEPAAEAAAEPKAEAKTKPALTPEEQAEADRRAAEKAAAKAAEKAAEAERRRQHKEMLDGLFAELEKIHSEGGTIEVTILERIKGGLRAQYKDLRLFLPASHFSLKRAPTEAEMQSAIGQIVTAHINEIQQDEQGRKTVVVSRRKLLTSDFFGSIKEGDIVEGKIVSIASFGVFVDLNGVEGLIHISRLSNARIDDPSQIVKKGDLVKAKVLSMDKNSERISLSRRELEESPWIRVEQDFPAGTRTKGVVRRLADFGAYIGLRPGIEGLLRNSEISWGRRVQHPSEMLSVGQEIEALVISSSAENKRIALGLKQTKPNPWDNAAETLPVGSTMQAIVRQTSANGLIVSVNDDFDGFIPRSKIRNIGGKAKNYAAGETLEVMVVDVNPENFSLILAPKYDEAELAAEAAARENRPQRRDNRSHRNERERTDSAFQSDGNASVTFLDLLSDDEQKGLRGGN